MRDAFSGYFNVAVLSITIIIVIAFISLSFNYSRAYRVKNIVLTDIEKYEGNVNNNDMLSHIQDNVEAIGYRAAQDDISVAEQKGYTCAMYNGSYQGWCYEIVPSSTKKDEEYVKIVVFINLRVPFIRQLFSQLGAFEMTGVTQAIPILDE